MNKDATPLDDQIWLTGLLRDEDMLRTRSQRLNYWNTLLHYGLEEARRVRSIKDVRILCEKAAYLYRRMRGNPAFVGSIPPGIQVEPTNYCNARCICCPTSRSTRKRGFMELSLFQRIVDDAQWNGIKIVHLYLHGEPLLHPKIVAMIEYIKRKGLAVHLITNGMLLSRGMALGILKAGVDLADHFTFSILGSSKEVHEQVMGRVGHERVLENLDTLLKLRRDMRLSGPIIETTFYPMPENQHEAAGYLNTFKGYVDHARLAPQISRSFANLNSGRDVSLSIRRKPCAQLQERLTVFWNGDVTICHQDLNGESVFGNLGHQSLQEVCGNHNLLHVQKMHSTRQFEKIHSCSKCDM